MAKLNSEDPLFDKDVVNLRTLNNALKKVQDSTLSKALQKFESEKSNNLKVENNTLFIKNARLAEDGGAIFSGGTDLSNIFKTKESKPVESIIYDNENKITLNVEGESLEILINEFNDLLIKGDLNVGGDIIYYGERLEDVFVKKEDFLEKEFKSVFVNSSIPSLHNFKETPDSVNTDFTSDVFYGSEIVFLNGLMQRKDLDYEIIDGEQKKVRFNDAPKLKDLINIYGIQLSEPKDEIVEKKTFNVVSNTEELLSIPENERTAGMLVYNLENELFFSLKNTEWKFDISDWSGLDIKKIQENNLIFLDKELPEGQIDGFNNIFLLKNIPKLNSEHVYLNGLLQDSFQNNDYSIIENVITFNIAPLEGSKIICTYRF